MIGSLLLFISLSSFEFGLYILVDFLFFLNMIHIGKAFTKLRSVTMLDAIFDLNASLKV